MDLLEAMQKRHSVRRYTDRRIDADTVRQLETEIQQCNLEGGLHLQLCLDEPNAFASGLAHYGSFSNVKNYIAVVGKKGKSLEERCGYYGERVVLKAAQLGLNTCWVALTYSKRKTACTIAADEKLVCVIALGYGETDGTAHKSKSLEQVCRTADGTMPDWFQKGVEAALLAPTATNQQKFLFTLSGNQVALKALAGFYAKLDLGIVKYHFEIGAGQTGWQWQR